MSLTDVGLLREPTDAMIAAALEAMSAPPDPDDFRRGWRAAINAALRERVAE